MKVVLGIVFVIMLVCAIIGGLVWPYTITTIGLFFGKTIVVKFWQGAFLGFCPVVGQLTIPIAIVVWILSLFLL